MSAPPPFVVDDFAMSDDAPIRVSDTVPPPDLPADVQNVWRRLAPLVDRSGVVVLPRHIPFAYRAMCELVALYRMFRVTLTDEIPWFKVFGITARQVARVV